MTERIKLIILKAFDIKSSEFRRTLLMQLYIFLLISTLLIIKPVVNGIFLTRFGVEALPAVFILIAIVASMVTGLYAWLVRKISFFRLSLGTLICSILLLLIFVLAFYLSIFETIVLYLFYVWVAIFGLLITSQFWVIANMVFTTRQAKRVFGFIGAGAIAGGIFGGYLTSVLTLFMDSE